MAMTPAVVEEAAAPARPAAMPSLELLEFLGDWNGAEELFLPASEPPASGASAPVDADAQATPTDSHAVPDHAPHNRNR